MAEQGGAAPGTGRVRGLAKALTAACVGLGGGVIATYTTAVVDRVTKPGKPVANFAVTADGLSVTCQNHATAETGWWDFGDGSPLEPFAPEQPAMHTYKKAGDYAVKLTVRNFLNEEAERSVPVDLSATAPQALPPSVTKLTAEPINPSSVAPAAFRIRGEVANAEKVIWDLGDGKLDVTTDSGPFERLVVFDKPGTHGIQVIGSTGKQAVKQAAAVTVAAPAAGSFAVVLQVTDAGTRGMTEEFSEWVKVSLPKAATETKFETTVPVRRGMAADEARIGPMSNPTVKNVQVAVAPDKKSMKLTGDWAMTGEALAKSANNGLGVMIPVKIVAEKAVPFLKPPTEMAKPLTGSGPQVAAVLDLPPVPPGLLNAKRRVRLDIRQASADGQGQVLATVTDPQFPWTASLPTGGTATAQMVGGQLRVAVTTGGVAVVPAAVPYAAPAPVPPAAPVVAPHLHGRPYTTPSPVQQFGRPQGVR